MTYLLDTNVLIRFLVNDNPTQHKQAIYWFQQAEKEKIQIKVVPLVIAETTFVLESFYKVNKDEIAQFLTTFLSQPWLEVPERKVLLSLWPHYQKGLHFVDSYLLATAQTLPKTKVLSFDKQLLKKDEI
jgi:predicted nucleic acid-binding protein